MVEPWRRTRLHQLPFLSGHEPYLASVRGDPRFEALMVRVKREWEAFEA